MAWPLKVFGQQLSLFCVQKTQIRTKVIYGTEASYDYPLWQIYSGGMFGQCVQMAAKGRGRMARNDSLA
jgi:hypothetical protein